MIAEDIVVLVIVVPSIVVFVICMIGALTGLTLGEMIDAITPIRRRKYWLRQYVEMQTSHLGREATRGDIAFAIERFDIDPRGRIREMKTDDRRRRLTEELLPTSARIAELEEQIDPKPSSLGRSSRPWEVYPDGWRFR